MADGTITLNVGASGKVVDTTELTVGGNTVERERLVIAGAAATELADVKNADQGVAGTSYGQVVRLVGQNPVVLYDNAGNAIAVADAATLGSGKALPIVGSDGANYRIIKTDTAGRQVVAGATTADPGANPSSLPALAVAVVSDVPASYTPDELRPLSVNQEGRLRVVSVSPPLMPDFYASPWTDAPSAFAESPWKGF